MPRVHWSGDLLAPGRSWQVDSPTDPLLDGTSGVEWLLQANDREATARWRDRLSFMLGSNWVPHGYGWVFPMESARLKIGVSVTAGSACRNQPTPLSLCRCRFSGWFSAVGLSICPVMDRHGGRLSRARMNRSGKARLTVRCWSVGDAASSANLLGGEGIRHAMGQRGDQLSKCC